MPRTHLLDTSVYSQLIRPAMPATVAGRWQTVGDAAMVIASICDAEVLYGIKKAGSIRLLRDYGFVMKGCYHVLDVDSEVAAPTPICASSASAPALPCRTWTCSSPPRPRLTISLSPRSITPTLLASPVSPSKTGRSLCQILPTHVD